MKKRSAASETVRVGVKDSPRATQAELDALLARSDDPVDYSDDPPSAGPRQRVRRDARGRLPEPLPELRSSPIRKTILEQLGRQEMTRYELWQKARVYCPRIPGSAVYEYLRGQREIGTPYVEALLQAAGLEIAPIAERSSKRVRGDRARTAAGSAGANSARVGHPQAMECKSAGDTPAKSKKK
jgi:hypothetical protein